MKNIGYYLSKAGNKIDVLYDKVVARVSAAVNNLEREEFYIKSDDFTIPGEIVSHKNTSTKLPTIFWCHGGPHDRSEHTFLVSIAKNLKTNVVGFDFRGSQILDNHYQNINSTDYGPESAYYTSVDKDYGGGHMRDLQAVVEHVCNNTKFDNNQFIIAGHSFGGYMVAMSLTSAELSPYFKLGIAWSGFYDLGEWKAINCSFEGPLEEVLRRQAPKDYLYEINQKIVILHGGPQDKTSLVSREGAESFVAALKEQNKDVIVLFKDNANHHNLDFFSAMEEVFHTSAHTLEELMGVDNTNVDSI